MKKRKPTTYIEPPLYKVLFKNLTDTNIWATPKVKQTKKNKSVYVRSLDIAFGKMYSGSNCPVALAMKRAFNTDKVIVGLHSARVNGGAVMLPAEAQQFIEKFDSNKHVEPFTFKV
jgi:hypothetical protein